MGYLGAFTGIAFLIIGIVQAIVGYLGIEYHLGTLAAVIAIIIAFFWKNIPNSFLITLAIFSCLTLIEFANLEKEITLTQY